MTKKIEITDVAIDDNLHGISVGLRHTDGYDVKFYPHDTSLGSSFFAKKLD